MGNPFDFRPQFFGGSMGSASAAVNSSGAVNRPHDYSGLFCHLVKFLSI